MAKDKTKVRGRPFQKGQSGNPGGRPKDLEQVAKLARTYTVKAIKTLAKWMESDNPKASVSSAIALLERGWGKANQPVSNPDGTALQFTIRIGDDADKG